jgi:TRAP-type mannitol/chloroaromatic compound transport system permease small subunit
MKGTMNADSGAPPPRTTLLDRAVIVMNAVGSLWVLFLVVLIDIDAGGRTLFNMPIAGMIEFVAVSLAVIVFCQLADTIRLGKLTRSDTFLARLAGGTQGGRAVAAGFELLGAVVMGLILAGTIPLLLQSYERGYFIGVRGVFAFPDWPVKAVVVIGAVAALLCFLVRVRRIWLGLPTNLGADPHEAGE